MGDLLSLDVGTAAPAPAAAPAAAAAAPGGFDPFGLDALSAPVSAMAIQEPALPVVLTADKGKRNNRPVVTYGCCTEEPFGAVVAAIRDTAFVSSQLPVVVSLLGLMSGTTGCRGNSEGIRLVQ